MPAREIVRERLDLVAVTEDGPPTSADICHVVAELVILRPGSNILDTDIPAGFATENPSPGRDAAPGQKVDQRERAVECPSHNASTTRVASRLQDLLEGDHDAKSRAAVDPAESRVCHMGERSRKVIAMTWTVELASAEDAFAMANVLTEASRHVYSGIVSDETLATFLPDRLAHGYRADIERGRDYWIARVGTEVIGMAHSGPARNVDEPAALELTMIYVLPEFQGSGAAQALLYEAIKGADCFLWVAARNARAQSFYRRNGFELDGATKSVVPLDGIEGLRMVRGRVD